MGIFHVFVRATQEWEIGVDGSYDVLTTRAYVFRYPHIGPELLFICVFFLFRAWQGTKK
jgi:hypothetical protein